jgi:hypothetical protein
MEVEASPKRVASDSRTQLKFNNTAKMKDEEM